MIDGHLVNNFEDVLENEVLFYEKLYTKRSENTKIDEYLESVMPENILTDEESNKCEGLITFSECELAIAEMKLNKSPGNDGITVEFYKTFWNHIKELLVNSFNETYEKNELSESQKIGTISLLYKKGDPQNIENWRPISLLNNDYKILTRVLANRLQKVLPSIISQDQQGYIKSRYIGNNIRQISDVIQYCEDENIEGALLFLDFRKAFDTIELDFLYKVLKKYNFKPMFTRWISSLYKNIYSTILNNGWISRTFSLTRGLRQGCCISSLLFLIVAEILATKIRSLNSIKGINVKIGKENHTLKLTQLADDTYNFISKR